jgi:hypothetical protein
MRLPGRLDAIDEADESRPLLESAPPMPSSRIDRRSGAASASASISPRISAVVRGCFGDNVIGCRCAGRSAHHGGDRVLQCAQFWRDFPLAGALLLNALTVSRAALAAHVIN